ncbi:MAG: DUF4111 domain-containing protein [Ardenticatenales bacterium]|nr:DUF4111 domain-containing protein [Ardenticatenales bacterium]
MSNLHADLTPYLEINALLQMLLDEVRAVLAAEFVGLYVHGSLASGDFAPGRSDVDFVVVTKGALPEEVLPALAAMHQRLRVNGGKWAAKMEGSYIPRAALRRHDPAHSHFPALRMDGSFDVDEHGSDWIIQRHILRQHGLALAGPSPRTLIDPVPAESLRQAAWGILDTWWRAKLDDPALLRTTEYQSYAVLTMCRALYTMRHGQVVSKTAAADWARAHLETRWHALIAWALAWPDDDSVDHFADTLAFVAATLQAGDQVR